MKLNLSEERFIKMNLCLDITYDDVYDDITSQESRELARAVEINASQYYHVFSLGETWL